MMTIYSDTLQQQTDQLVADVATLDQAVANSDSAGIANAANAVQTDAENINTTINAASTDIPPDNTMILYLATDLTSEVDVLQSAITAADSDAIATATTAIDETTANIDNCVARMAEVQAIDYFPPIIPGGIS
jgi:hypothetical protein